MGQLQKVSWKAAGYAALGTALAAASVIAVINSDGVHPTSLTSNAATRWLVDRVNGNVVLVDGLAGRVLAKITTDSNLEDEVAVQGAGGAFLVGQSQGAVRTISTAKLQLGTAQPIALLTEPKAKFGVGASGLTVVSPDAPKAKVVAVDDVSRDINVPTAEEAMVAADGSMWLLSQTDATHVNVDQSSATVRLRSNEHQQQQITVGAKAVTYDDASHTVRWLDGTDVSVDTVLPNPSEAILQESGDAAPCVWIGSDDTLACVGDRGVDQTLVIKGMHLVTGDRLAVAGTTGVIVTEQNDVTRLDLASGQVADDSGHEPDVRANAGPLKITAAGDMIWLDDLKGEDAWVVQRYGINFIDKNASAPLLDAQGQVQDQGDGLEATPTPGGPTASGDEESDHIDPHPGVQDPPVAVDDSVTARAGNVVTIPVTANDYDPDGEAIAVSEGDTRSATHGSTDVLSNGTSIAYRPEAGYSGTDSFVYTIVDEHGASATATVNIELFSPDSPNRPPIARSDTVKTRLGRPVTIDVLSNDIDPERDMLTVSSFQGFGSATVTATKGPTGLPALLYTPPPGQPGTYQFTYQAADPQGGISQKTEVTVDVSSSDSANSPPTAKPDSIRLSVGVMGTLPVKANDTDDDGDPLTISYDEHVTGVDVKVVSQQLSITLLPGAEQLSVIHYKLTDDVSTTPVIGAVLIVRLDDTAPNRPPVANPDVERVVIGNSVKIAVTANDVDPENDPIRLLSAAAPSDGAGTTTVEGNSVRFSPNLPDITEPTPVTFAYTISDGHGNEATGNVTVTVLVEALPSAPFAADDFGDTVTNKPVTIDVLANDSDPSGGKPSLIADPVCAGGGSAVRTSDNRVAFTPPTGATGTFKCKYTVANSQGLRAEASIIIAVTPAPASNSAPIMDTARIFQTVNVGETLSLTADDVANDADNDSLVFTSVSVVAPAHGSTNFTQKAAGIVYTAPMGNLADRIPTTDTLTVVISDGHDGNTTGTISIKIVDNTPLPTAPPVTHEILRPWTVGTPLTVDVVAELRDQNPNTTLTLTAATLQSGPGTVSLAGGVAVIEPTGPGTIVANYTVVNSGLASANDRITVTVTEPPPANPPVANPDAMTIDSGGSNSIDLLANDTGISDPGDVPSVTLVNRPPTNFGTVSLVNSTLTFVAAPGADGLAVIRYTLTDGTGLSSTANVSLNVLQCSESPPNANPGSLFTPYQTPINIDLRPYITAGHLRPGSVSGAGLTDVTGTYVPPPGFNGTETVTYIVQNGCQQTAQGVLTIDVNRAPVGSSITRNPARGDTLVVPISEFASDDEALTIIGISGNPDWIQVSGDAASIVATPARRAPTSTTTVTVTVQDLGGLTTTATITFVVSNQAPTAIADSYDTDEASFTFDPTENDDDSEPGPLAIQSISWVSPSGGPNPVLNGTDVTVQLSATDSTLSYTIVDSGGLTAISTISIHFNQNRAPTIQNGTLNMNGQLTATFALDIFEPEGDAVTLACQVTPTTVSVDLHPTAGPNPDLTHPSYDLEVNVPQEFIDTNSTATVHCTVRDSSGATGSADIFVTAT